MRRVKGAISPRPYRLELSQPGCMYARTARQADGRGLLCASANALRPVIAGSLSGLDTKESNGKRTY